MSKEEFFWFDVGIRVFTIFGFSCSVGSYFNSFEIGCAVFFGVALVFQGRVP